MVKQTSVNLDITPNSDGYDISGGTTKRKITTSGADITFVGAGAATMTMPSTSVDDTLVGITATQTLSNKTIASPIISGKVASYNGVSVAGWGVPAIYGSGRATAQTAANASIATYTVGASDGSFIVSANLLVTTSSAEAFTVTVSYTDEGNTARTLTLNFAILAGTLSVNIAFANGAVPYEGVPLHIRAKASTAITIKTAAGGTYTGCTYNVEGMITQIA